MTLIRGIATSAWCAVLDNIFGGDTDAIAIFQDMVVANSRENFLMILVNKTKLLQKLIEAGLSENTKPKDRLAIYKVLGEMQDKLAQELQVNSHDDALAAEFLRGPVLRKGVSRFSADATIDGK